MKYMLMMNVPGSGPYQIGGWPKADIQAHIGHMIALNKTLREAGEFVSAEGLSSPDQAEAGARRQGRCADHRRCVPGVEGVPGRVLDRGRGQRRPRV
jgi:hypothetical protein